MLWLEELLLRVPTRTMITNKSMVPRIMKANIMFLHLFDCETVGSIFSVSQEYCESLAATECRPSFYMILHLFLKHINRLCLLSQAMIIPAAVELWSLFASYHMVCPIRWTVISPNSKLAISYLGKSCYTCTVNGTEC